MRWRYLMRVGLAVMLVSALGGAADVAADSSKSGGAESNGFSRSRVREGDHSRLDRKLNDRDRQVKGGTSRVIIQLKPGFKASDVTGLGGKLGRRLGLIDGQVAELPNRVLRKLADNPAVARIVWDRPTGGEMNRVAVTVGARAIQETLGYTGAGIGVAVIDSGVTTWHDDLTYNGTSSVVRTKNGQRVAAFVDFVNNQHGAVRRQRSRDARLRDHRRQRIRHARRACRYRAVGAPGGPEGPRSQWPRGHQRRDCRARLGGHEQGALQHPRHQPVGWRGGYGVLHHGPADAGGQARRRCRHRRRDGGGQPGKERPRASRSTAASRRRATRPGC